MRRTEKIRNTIPKWMLLSIGVSALILSSNLYGMSMRTNSANTYPQYAMKGAYAFYSGNGGFIPFLSGVSGNISYTVTDIYSNDSMRVWLYGNLSLGTELGINVSTVSENFTDSIFAPKILPAVPAMNLTAKTLVFQNFTCQFESNEEQTVPAGTFNATEFQTKDSNGTILDFWFDRSSGLAIQMLEAGSYFQLVDSNIAIPLSTQSPLASEIPFIAVFVVGWAGAGLLFYWVRRHYIKKSEREGLMQTEEKGSKKTKREPSSIAKK